MKFEITCDDREYYIEINNGEYLNPISDRQIAHVLDLSLKEYQDILIQHGAYYFDLTNKECYFRTREEIEAAVETLNPYLIMATLMEDKK